MWGLQFTAQVYSNPLVFLSLLPSLLHEHLQTLLYLHYDTGRHSYLHTVR